MTKPTIRIHDLATNEIIDREMTAQEIADHDAATENLALLNEQVEAKKVAAQEKLAALGLTTDDLKALGLGGN